MLCHPRISRIQRTRFLGFSNSPEAGRFLGNRIGVWQSVASRNSSRRVPLEDAERDNEKHQRNIPPRTDSSQEKRILKDSLPFLNRYMDRFINFFNCSTYHSHIEKIAPGFPSIKCKQWNKVLSHSSLIRSGGLSLRARIKIMKCGVCSQRCHHWGEALVGPSSSYSGVDSKGLCCDTLLRVSDN